MGGFLRGGQRSVPCSIYRGGTSKAVLFCGKDLPKDPQERTEVLLKIMGSPDPRQIDGLGGADPLTSRVGIVSSSKDPTIDIEYQFAFVHIEKAQVDFESFCGNVLSGAVAFAVEEGFVPIVSPETCLRVLDLNTKILVEARVPVLEGKVKNNEPMLLSLQSPAGTFTGKLLPTGNPIDVLETSLGPIQASLVDCVDPVVFVRARDLGLRGNESPKELEGGAICQKLEELRLLGAQKIGTPYVPLLPKIVFVSPPGEAMEGVVVRMLAAQRPHKAYGVSCGICTVAAARIPGSLVNEMYQGPQQGKMILHHPTGTMRLEPVFHQGTLERVSIERTARCLMKGQAVISS